MVNRDEGFGRRVVEPPTYEVTWLEAIEPFFKKLGNGETESDKDKAYTASSRKCLTLYIVKRLDEDGEMMIIGLKIRLLFDLLGVSIRGRTP